MAEYTADELTDDSGDEKRIEKAAEHRALKKRRKRGGMGMAGRSRTGRIPQGPSSSPTGAPSPFHQPATSAPRQPFPPGLPAAQVAGPCFACGEMGHIRLHCPKMAAGGAESTRRWYPYEGESE